MARAFVDANVLVYAFDASAGAKKSAAERLLADLWEAGTGCVSVQVLQEFYVTVTRKVARPLATDEGEDRVREFATWNVFVPTAHDVLAAIDLHKRQRLGFWDAMIIHAAVQSGCDVLWSEDLQDDRVLQGVRIRNPFRSAEAPPPLDRDG